MTRHDRIGTRNPGILRALILGAGLVCGMASAALVLHPAPALAGALAPAP